MFTLQECAGVTDEEMKREKSAKNNLKAQTREHFSKPSASRKPLTKKKFPSQNTINCPDCGDIHESPIIRTGSSKASARSGGMNPVKSYEETSNHVRDHCWCA
jgi:hypothetical protein